MKCLNSLPQIKSRSMLVFSIISGAFSGLALVYLALDNFAKGLGLMLISPLYLNIYFGKAPIQSALFDYENDKLGVYSMLYSRPFYLLMLAILRTFHPSTIYLTIALVLPFCFSFGLLSNPFVTLFYLIEQADIYVFGNTARINDLRLLISFGFNCCISLLCFSLTFPLNDESLTQDSVLFWVSILIPYVLLCGSSYVLTYNYQCLLGIGPLSNLSCSNSLVKRSKKKQRPQVNQSVQMPCISEQAKAGSHPTSLSAPAAIIRQDISPQPSLNSPSLKNQSFSLQSSVPIYQTKTKKFKDNFFPALISFIISLFVLILVFLLGSFFTQESLNSLRYSLLALSILILGSFTIINEIIVAREQLVVFGCIRSSCYKQKPIALRSVQIVKTVEHFFLVFFFSLVNVFSLHYIDRQYMASSINRFFFIAFSMQFFSFLLKDLQTTIRGLLAVSIYYRQSSFLYLLLLTPDFPFPLMFSLSIFIIQRVFVLIRKLQFWFLNIGMICSGETFFIHDDAECLNPLHLMTIPISVGVISLTTFLDSPSLPYLGSVTTMIGFPRPQRFWPRFNHLQHSGSRIEGLIYQSILPELMRSVEKEMQRQFNNFQDQSYYLILNESTGLLISVIERGRNYAVVVARGAQIKSATLCHRDQRSRIAETLEDVIAIQRKCLFQTKGASLSPIRHLKEIKGLMTDSFNLSSRCMFDIDFNRKLLKIFLYLLIESYEELSRLNEEEGQPGDRIMQQQITEKQFTTLHGLFPHGFARQRIHNYKWLKGRPDRLMTRNTSMTPRYESSMAQSVRDISLHGMNTPQGSVGAFATSAEKIPFNGGDEESQLNEPSFLASIQQHPGEMTSAFFTKVQREISGGRSGNSSSVLGAFSHARTQVLGQNFSSALSPQDNRKNQSAFFEHNFKLQLPVTLGRQSTKPMRIQNQLSKTDRIPNEEESKEAQVQQKLKDFTGSLNPKQRKRALSDSSYDIVNDEWYEDEKEASQTYYSPLGSMSKEGRLSKTQNPFQLLNFTRVEIPKMNSTYTPKDRQYYGRGVIPLSEAVESWYEDDQEIEEQDMKSAGERIPAIHRSNPVLPVTFSASDLKDKIQQRSPTTRLFGNKMKEKINVEVPRLSTYHVDPRTHFLLELCLVCFPFLDEQPNSFNMAYENILNCFTFLRDNSALNINSNFHQKLKLHSALQLIFSKALIATYLRVIHLEEEPLKGFKDITSILQNYKIIPAQQFKEARFSESEGEKKPTTSASELDSDLIYCSVFAHDDIEIHQLRTGKTDFTMFGMKKEFLRNIWGNMMFEILFVHNDNSERNSLQSNRFVLQNLSSELAEHPLGYCAYSSGPMLLYF